MSGEKTSQLPQTTQCELRHLNLPSVPFGDPLGLSFIERTRESKSGKETGRQRRRMGDDILEPNTLRSLDGSESD